MSIVVPMTRPTIMDVARACGLSKTTVSVILNDSPASARVPDETKNRVRAAAEQLGYRPSWRGRVLAGRNTHMIGILYTPPMPLIVRGNYEGIMAGINEVFSQRGYQMLLVPLGEDRSQWGHILMDQRMDGALVLSRLLDPLAQALQRSRLPFALINADAEARVPMVLADEVGGTMAAARHLLELGHRRIAFYLGHQPPHYSVTGRVSTYEKAMREAGAEEHIQVFTGPLDAFVQQLRDADPASRPTAVMVYQHYLATKLLQIAWEAGLRVPDDLSVVAFGNAYPVEDTIPPLTAVALPTEEMGRTAAQLVLDQITSENPPAPKRVVLGETLVVRKSTSPPVT